MSGEFGGTTLYRLRDARGALLYVGISDNVERRLLEHVDKWWWGEVKTVDKTPFPSRFDAERAEREAIEVEAPAYNRRHNPFPGRRAGDPAPVTVRHQPVRKGWLSQKEAAQYLGVTDRTIRNYVRTGALKGFRPKGSRLIRFRESDLDAMMRPVPAAAATP